MRRILLTLIIALLSFTLAAQKDQAPLPDEIHVIGFLKKHKYGEHPFGSVYDKRTNILYQFPLARFDEDLIDDNEYIFRLLATCSSTNCYGVNYTIITYTTTFWQNQKDRIRVTKDAPKEFRHPKKPTKYHP